MLAELCKDAEARQSIAATTPIVHTTVAILKDEGRGVRAWMSATFV